MCKRTTSEGSIWILLCDVRGLYLDIALWPTLDVVPVSTFEVVWYHDTSIVHDQVQAYYHDLKKSRDITDQSKLP